MTNEPLYLAIGVPAALYLLLTTVVLAYITAKTDGLSTRFNDKFDSLQKQIVELKETLRAEMREMRAEIRLEIKESADRRLIGGR